MANNQKVGKMPVFQKNNDNLSATVLWGQYHANDLSYWYLKTSSDVYNIKEGYQ